MRVLLPARDTVVKTGPTDPVLYHYQPVVRRFLLKRLQMILSLMGDAHFERLLDGGCGGGIFLPELARHCTTLYASDVHDQIPAVQAMAARNNVSAEIRQASLLGTGYPSDFFDAVVIGSVLEFVPDLGGAVDELRRIVKPGGSVFVGFPAANRFVRAGYAAIRAPRSSDVHHSQSDDIQRALASRFDVRREIRFPAWLPPQLSLYFACHCVRPDAT
jgi:ubiquinone/menaquinone biosynthesis C-methylase UbiE